MKCWSKAVELVNGSEGEEKELTEAQKKLQGIKSGGRIKVKSVESIFADLFGWGKKDSDEPVEEIDPNDVPVQEEEDGNLWKRKFGK